MGILKEDYELSIWQSVQIIENNKPKIIEERVAIIGTHSMSSQNKAHNITLTRNTNGTKTLTFMLYSQYIDHVSGKKVNNPFVSYLKNETILKLFYKQEWYDFVIKTCAENSENHTYSYTASDLHINELSKNGFNLVMDPALNNDTGTLCELGQTVLHSTDWSVDIDNSHLSVQTIDEALVRLSIPAGQQITAVRVLDPDKENPQGVRLEQNVKIPSVPTSEVTIVHAFYSSCKNKPKRFQFIYVPLTEGELVYNTDDNRIILNENSQYFIEYSKINEIYTKTLDNYGFAIPNFFNYDNQGSLTTDNDASFIPVTLKGRRYVFGQISTFNNLLGVTMWQYKDKENSEKKCWGYTKTNYVTPKIIQNFGGNNDFKSTSGWDCHVIVQDVTNGQEWAKDNLENTEPYRGTVEAQGAKDCYNDLIDGVFSPNKNYIQYLRYSMPTEVSGDIKHVLVSSGPYDNRSTIKNMINGEEYIVFFKSKDGRNPRNIQMEVAPYYYFTSKSCYLKQDINGNEIKPFLTFTNNWQGITSNFTKFAPVMKEYSYNNYYYQIVSVKNGKFTEKEFQILKTQLFIYSSDQWDIEDLQFTKVVRNSKGQIVLPISSIDENVIEMEYIYYDKEELEQCIDKTTLKPVYSVKDIEPDDRFIPQYYDTAEKVRSVKVKESNYFNALQSICETFQTWIKFVIERDSEGKILSKKIAFKNYIGKENYTGFKYGVNLKSISRNVDSKNIVTKMIVKNNANQSAKNGYCSITRAGGNETGENYLYDFSYYINHGLIDGEKLASLLYDTTGAQGVDRDKHFDTWLAAEDAAAMKNKLNPASKDYMGKATWNCQGYYTRLKTLNTRLDKEIEISNNYYLPLNQAQADLTVAQTGYDSAREELENISLNFLYSAGFDITAIDSTRAETIKENDNLREYVIAWAENSIAETKFLKDLTALQEVVNNLKIKYENQNTIIQFLTECKNCLNLQFQKLYSRFIQEGTWIEEKYSDDEEYYIDAQSTMYNSCFPQTTYTINVIEISKIPGFEYFVFDLGDKSFVEDVEFFGYNQDGTPYREEIVLTEIKEVLDNPSKNTLKVQNYKTQFQDLFQRITASVQSTKFSQGSYDKAASLISGKNSVKASFVEEAFTDSSLVLQNAGEQSVVQGPEGLIVTDKLNPSQQIRLIGGAILIKDKGSDGVGVWKTAMTSKGIVADTITTGVLNTSSVQIMNGKNSTFRWDAYGLNAYWWEGTDEIISSVYLNKGVRFDKSGIYGFESTSPNFNPYTKEGVNGNAESTTNALMDLPEIKFALTWAGLKIKRENVSIRLGYFDNNIFSIINDKTNATILSISKEGEAVFAGTVNASGGRFNGILEVPGVFKVDTENNLVNIAGWKVDSNSLTIGTLGAEESYWMCSAASGTQTKAQAGFIGGNVKGWSLAIGKNFGVKCDGKLYATGADLTGIINADGGRIGKVTISTTDTKTSLLSSSVDFVFGSAYANFECGHESIADTQDTPNVKFAYKLTQTSGPKSDYNSVAAKPYYEAKTATYTLQVILITDEPNFLLQPWEGVVTGTLNISTRVNGTIVTRAVTINKSAPFERGSNCLSATFTGINTHIGYYYDAEPALLADGEYWSVKPTASINIDDNDTYNVFTIQQNAVLIPLKDDDNWNPLGIGLHDNKMPFGYFKSLDSEAYYGQMAYFEQIFSNNNIIQTSDIKVKDHINYLYANDKFAQLYDKLQPVMFSYIFGNSGRTHIGLYAQDVKEALNSTGINSKEFAAYCEWDQPNSFGATCGIRYEELISLNIWEIQKLKKRVSQLEQRLANLTSSQNSDIIYIEENKQEN